MRNIKVWAWIVLFMGMTVFFSKSIIYDGSFVAYGLFPRSWKFAFNYIGVYFGVSGIILYVGKLSIVPNRQMMTAIIVGYLSYWLQFYAFPIHASTGSLLTIMLWAVGAISFFILYGVCFISKR